MNSHRGSYVAEAARSTGHGDGGARGRVRREGARRRATRERTVADRNGRDFLRRGVDATSWGGEERADAPDTSNPNRSKSPLAATSTTLRRAGPGRDASARCATSAETARRAVASTDGTARAASPAAAPSASASASASRPVSWRAARARRRSTAARARRGRPGRRGGRAGRREGGAEAPRSMTWRAGASSGIVGRRGRRRARVCSPRARARRTREARVPSSARVRARARDRGSDETLARVASLGKPARRPPPRTCRRRAHCKPPLSDSCTPHVQPDWKCVSCRKTLTRLYFLGSVRSLMKISEGRRFNMMPPPPARGGRRACPEVRSSPRARGYPRAEVSSTPGASGGGGTRANALRSRGGAARGALDPRRGALTIPRGVSATPRFFARDDTFS